MEQENLVKQRCANFARFFFIRPNNKKELGRNVFPFFKDPKRPPVIKVFIRNEDGRFFCLGGDFCRVGFFWLVGGGFGLVWGFWWVLLVARGALFFCC